MELRADLALVLASSTALRDRMSRIQLWQNFPGPQLFAVFFLALVDSQGCQLATSDGHPKHSDVSVQIETTNRTPALPLFSADHARARKAGTLGFLSAFARLPA